MFIIYKNNYFIASVQIFLSFFLRQSIFYMLTFSLQVMSEMKLDIE